MFTVLNRKYEHRTVPLHTSPQVVFRTLYGHEPHGFLYESLEHAGGHGRYSFLGGRPLIVMYGTGESMTLHSQGKRHFLQENPVTTLRRILASCRVFPDLDMFGGGAVGYCAYDTIRFYERIPAGNPDTINTPDYAFMIPAEIIVFDHEDNKVEVIAYGGIDDQRLDTLCKHVTQKTRDTFMPRSDQSIAFENAISKARFMSMVEKAKEYIFAGDIFQVVLSQRISSPLHCDPYSLYCSLRITNPSPYMYFLKFRDYSVLGSSPETLVKVQDDLVTSRPIAGTRPRGTTPQQDHALADDLQQDEKENAEHIMLVDLARNDLGRICEYGSIQVTDQAQIERYSRVMHLTSNVTGQLRSGLDAFDVLRATFPAGTVSGAPKIRAMEIIEELEPVQRGIYAGAIGYCGYDGNMDMCIAIRTIVVQKNTVFIQGGAGIVADSIPEREYHETLHKMDALKRAVEIAP